MSLNEFLDGKLEEIKKEKKKKKTDKTEMKKLIDLEKTYN
jgi:hypothetical protein